MLVLVLERVQGPPRRRVLRRVGRGTTRIGTKRFSLGLGRGGKAVWRVLGLLILGLGMGMAIIMTARSKTKTGVMGKGVVEGMGQDR